jgi:hypothetical protein
MFLFGGSSSGLERGSRGQGTVLLSWYRYRPSHSSTCHRCLDTVDASVEHVKGDHCCADVLRSLTACSLACELPLQVPAADPGGRQRRSASHGGPECRPSAVAGLGAKDPQHYAVHGPSGNHGGAERHRQASPAAWEGPVGGRPSRRDEAVRRQLRDLASLVLFLLFRLLLLSHQANSRLPAHSLPLLSCPTASSPGCPVLVDVAPSSPLPSPSRGFTHARSVPCVLFTCWGCTDGSRPPCTRRWRAFGRCWQKVSPSFKPYNTLCQCLGQPPPPTGCRCLHRPATTSSTPRCPSCLGR